MTARDPTRSAGLTVGRANGVVDLLATIGDRPDLRGVSGSHRTGPLRVAPVDQEGELMTMPARDLGRVRKMRVVQGQVLMPMLEVPGSLVGQTRAASRVAAAAMEHGRQNLAGLLSIIPRRLAQR